MTILLIILAIIFAGAGLTKLAGVRFHRDNFERWGYGDQLRIVVGLYETVFAIIALVGIAVTALAILAGLGGIALMIGALATHSRAADDGPTDMAPAVVVGLVSLAVFIIAL